MNITKEWLDENGACTEGCEWFFAQKETELSNVIKALIKDGKYDWANWTLTKYFNKVQNVQYSVYAAKQALHVFEKRFPQDKRPRLAIKAALKWVKHPSEITESAAQSAAQSAAESAVWSARSAWSAAQSAVWSAQSAWSAAQSARSAAWKKILKYGLKLVKESK